MLINRDVLLNALDLAKPSLSSNEFIPILGYFCFTKNYVVAFNDMTTIRAVLRGTNFQCAVKGDELHSFLSLSDGKRVDITAKNDDGLVFKIGSSKFKAVTLPKDDFIFPRPNTKNPDAEIDITKTFIKGLELCLISSSQDKSREERYGVTVKITENQMEMYSTDGNTISRFIITEDVPDTELELVLPYHFCQILVQTFSKLTGADDEEEEEKEILEATLKLKITKKKGGYIVAKFPGKCFIYSEIDPTVEPPEYEDILDRHLKLLNKKNTYKIPPKLIVALKKVDAILEKDAGRICTFKIKKGRLTILATSSSGSRIIEPMKLAKTAPDIRLATDPGLLMRVVANCNEIGLVANCVVLRSDPNYCYLVATKID